MYGATMKEVRKLKGFTQKEIYTGVVSKSFYSDFEADKYSVSVDKFLLLLQNLGVSFEEFQYFHNQMNLSEFDILEKKIDEAYNQGNFEKLFSIYEEYQNHLHREFRYLASKAYLLVLITNSNFYKFSREPFTEIISNLELVKYWTISEIKLAKLVLLSLSEKDLEKSKKLFDKIKMELEKYKNYKNSLYYKELADLYFNRMQSLLILNDISEAEIVFKAYSKMIVETDDFSLNVQNQLIQIILGLYLDYDNVEKQARIFLNGIGGVPVSECRFYKIIFQIHNEKARNYYSRYVKCC